MVDPNGAPISGVAVRLSHADGTNPSTDTQTNRTGEFAFLDVAVGWCILSASVEYFRETVTAVYGESRGSADVGAVMLQIDTTKTFAYEGFPPPPPPEPPIRVLTVCEALENRDTISYRRVVIVGIFKSGVDETLRLDCQTELITGDIGWPSAIGLTKVGNVPDELRGEVEKKRQEILSSAPPEAPLRPERVVGLYGVFVSLAGLTSAKCCSATVETVFPPARLFGISETDLRVIR